MLRILIVAATVVTMAAAPLAAQEGSGIAYVQAPEMGSGLCLGNSSDAAFKCARQKCVEGGGTAEACIDVAFCNPARISVDVFVQQKDGPHWHEFVCGLDSRATAMEVARVICDRARRTDLQECEITKIYDQNANEMKFDYGD